MPETSQHPGLLSWSFHTRFFPSVLRRILLPREKAYESPFASHAIMELTVILVLSLLACVVGYGAALGKGSIIGWLFAIPGTGGLLFIVVHSIRCREKQRPSFDNFRIGVFFLLLFLGFTGGLGVGHAYQMAYGTRLLSGFAGAFVGYILGIYGGLWVQKLGWLSEILNMFAGIALAGVIIVDILLLL